MHLAFVQLTGLSLGPDARVLLACHLRVHQQERVGRVQFERLATGLCQSAPVTKRALDELLGSGLLVSAPVVGARGRPSLEFVGTELLFRKLAGAADYPLATLVGHVLEPSNPLDSIHRVLTRQSDDSTEQALPGVAIERKRTARMALRQKVAGATRLLLAVLLAHADRWGVVQGLGSARLSELTGLSRERLQAHVYKLNQLGFIGHKVAGFSGSTLLGGRETVYYLNLHHPALRLKHSAGSIAILPTGTEACPRNLTEAGLIISVAEKFDCRLYDWALPESRFLGVEPSSGYMAGFFLTPRGLPGGQRAAMAAVQYLLDGYASVLLSNHWERLKSGRVFVDEALLQCAAQDFKPQDEVIAASESGGGMFLYRVAFALACRIQRMLLSLSELPLANSEYRILPPALPLCDQGFRTIVVFPREGAKNDALFLAPERGQIAARRIEFDQVDWKNTALLSGFKALKRYGARGKATTPEASGDSLTGK